MLLEILTLLSCRNYNILLKAEGISRELNHSIIKQILSKRETKVLEEGNNYIYAKNNVFQVSFARGRDVTFFFDEQHIYVNSQTSLKFGKSPFHWFVDRKIEREISLHFHKAIEKQKYFDLHGKLPN